jgi:hypothetical protein
MRALLWFVVVDIAIAATFTACGTLIQQPYSDTYADFSRHAVYTTAIVTAAIPQQHNSVEYRYVVDGTEYSGGASVVGPGTRLRVT